MSEYITSLAQLQATQSRLTQARGVSIYDLYDQGLVNIEYHAQSDEPSDDKANNIKSILQVVNDTQIIAPNTVTLQTSTVVEDYEARLDKMIETISDGYHFLLDGYEVDDPNDRSTLELKSNACRHSPCSVISNYFVLSCKFLEAILLPSPFS